MATAPSPSEMCSTDGRHLMLDGSTGQYTDVGACQDQENHPAPAEAAPAPEAESQGPLAGVQKGATGFNTEDPIVKAGLSLYQKVKGGQ